MKLKLYSFLIFFFMSKADCAAQKNALMIEGEKYILSEQLVTNKYPAIKVNSLFIWHENLIIRILFYKEKTISKKSLSAKSLLGLFPKPKNSRYESLEYHEQLRAAINRWNLKNNTLADKLGTEYNSEGSFEVLIKNKRRKKEYHNILPIAYNILKKDSVMIIQPYYINLYIKPKISLNNIESNGHLSQYNLFASVALITKETNADFYESGFRGLNEEFLYSYTLKRLYSFDAALKIPEDLKNFKQSEQKTFYLTAEEKKIYKADTNNNINNVLKKPSFPENGCAYQYCPDCYSTSFTKLDKILKGCPISIVDADSSKRDNLSYTFTKNGISFFKIENGVEPDFDGLKEATYTSYPFKWQLIIPGKGYFITDVSHFAYSDEYSKDNYSPFFLDGQSILNN
jgi:hypothetical protein